MNYHDKKPANDAFARALAGFDEAHEKALVDAITRAVADASMVSEPTPVLVIRTSELIGALTDTLAAAIAMSPAAARSPSAIRRTTDALRRRITRKVAEARGNVDFRAFEDRIFHDDDAERGGSA